MLESITEFTNMKIGLLRYLFQCNRDAKETDVVEIHVLFDLHYMAGMTHASFMNIIDFYQTYDTRVQFFHLIMTRKQFRFSLRAL